jgi:hypothetical protein
MKIWTAYVGDHRRQKATSHLPSPGKNICVTTLRITFRWTTERAVGIKRDPICAFAPNSNNLATNLYVTAAARRQQ